MLDARIRTIAAIVAAVGLLLIGIALNRVIVNGSIHIQPSGLVP